MTEKYQAQTTVSRIRETRGWNQHQYNRFRNAVIEEGKELLLGDKYWQGGHVKPDPVLWRNLDNSLVQDILGNLRRKLERDGVEHMIPLDDNVLRWKLLPWLRDNQFRVASAGKAPEPRRSEEVAMTQERDLATGHQSIDISASEELVEGTQPGITQGAPCEESHGQEDAMSTRHSRSSSFFDPIKDSLHQ